MKKKAFNTVESSGGFTLDCVKVLDSECGIGMSQLQHFLCCYGNAVKYPYQLDRSGPVIVHRTNDNSNEDVSSIETNARVGVVRNLSTFQLKPKGIQGKDLLSHMIGFRERNNDGTNGSKYTTTGSHHLNLEISKDNISVLESTNRLIAGENIESKRLIYRDASGSGATKKLNKRKLDALGDIRSHSMLANTEERLVQYKNRATLAASVAVLSTLKQSDKKLKDDNIKKEMNDLVDLALQMLVKVQGNLSKKSVTKKHIASILFVKYDTYVQVNKLKRDALVSQLSDKIIKNRSALGLDDDTDLSLLNGTTAMDNGNDVDEEDDEEEGEEVEHHEEEDEEEEDNDHDTSLDDDDDRESTQEEEDYDDDNSDEEDDGDDDDDDDDDFVPPDTIRKFFPGYGWFVGTVTTTTTTVTNRKHYRLVYEDDEEVCTQSDLKVLIMKQNIEIGGLGFEFVREYDGIFYSGIVTDINELGIECVVTTMDKCEGIV